MPVIGVAIRNSRRAGSGEPAEVVERGARGQGSAPYQPKKTRCLNQGSARSIQVAGSTDQIKQIAMFLRGGIRPTPRRPLSCVGAMQANIEAPPRCVVDIADKPITAFSAPV